MVVTQEWFTVEEAAEYLRVSKRTIYKLTEGGDYLPFVSARNATAAFARKI